MKKECDCSVRVGLRVVWDDRVRVRAVKAVEGSEVCVFLHVEMKFCFCEPCVNFWCE